MTIRYIIYNMAKALLAGVIVSSCTSSDIEPPTSTGSNGEPVSVGINLMSAPMGSKTSRAADWDTDRNPASNNELINNWFVVFISGNKIVEVVESTPASISSDKKSADVNVKLTGGSYTALAFANMNNEKLKAKFPIDKDVTGWEYFSLSSLASEGEDLESLFIEGEVPVRGTDLIPMTGTKVFTVPIADPNGVTIELTRMFCKVEFTFKNQSQTNVKINSITFKPTYTGDIYLFRNATRGKPSFPEKDENGNSYENGNPLRYDSHREEPNHLIGISATTAKNQRPYFYIKESVADGNHETGHFHIGLSLTRGDATKEDVTYALADDEFEWFVRNDYVLFPIVITDYMPEFELHDYPPIGGYPVEVTSSGNEFFATFTYSGTFDVKVKLRNRSGKVMLLDDDSTKDYYVKSITCDTESFQLTPYDVSQQAWHGTFQTSDGSIALSFVIYVNGLDYTRKLYLLS